MLCSPVRLRTMWRNVQVSAGTMQLSDAHPGHHNTSPGPARQDFFMNERAEQRFRQLEIQVRCSASPVYYVLGSFCPCMLCNLHVGISASLYEKAACRCPKL